MCLISYANSVHFCHVFEAMLVPLNMFKPSSDFFADHSKAELLCGSFFVIYVSCLSCYAVLSVPCSLVITC